MSGSGSGGGGGGYGPDVTSCDALFFRTTLNSPKPGVIAKLSVSDVLKLVKTDTMGPVIATTSLGEAAGSITSGHLLRLIQCLDEGYQFIAIVKSINYGKVEVDVRPGITT